VVELVAPAEVRVNQAYLAVTDFTATTGTIPEAQRLSAAPVVAELRAALRQSLDAEQTAVTRVANETAVALEHALATARTQLDEVGVET